MNISLEELTILILRELILELKRKGIKIDLASNNFANKNTDKPNAQISDLKFDGFKTPLVTEERILNLNKEVNEIVVPSNTIFTPSSMDLIKKKKIKITKQNK